MRRPVVMVFVATWGSAAIERPWSLLLQPDTDRTVQLLGASVHGRRTAPHRLMARAEPGVQSHGKRGRKRRWIKPWQNQPKA